MNENPTTDTLSPDTEAGEHVFKGGHFTPPADYDVDRISNCQTCGDYAICLCVWYTLVREASYKRSLTFLMSDDILAKRTCMNKKTADKAAKILESLGLLKSRKRSAGGVYVAAWRTIFPSVSPWKPTRIDPKDTPVKEACLPENGKRFPENGKRFPIQTGKKRKHSYRLLSKEKSSKEGTSRPALPPPEGGAAGRSEAPQTTPMAETPKPYTPPPRVVVERGRLPGAGAMRYRKFNDGTTEFDTLGNNFYGEEAIP